MVYFLDTNICVYILNNRYPYLVDRLEQYDRGDVKISALVYYELCCGAAKSQNQTKTFERLYDFVSEIEIVPFDEQIAEVAGKIRAELERKGQMIGGIDVLIAATALANGATLVTNNTREFERVSGLALENWVKAEDI